MYYGMIVNGPHILFYSAFTWDEHAIEEHDQLRGTRMKIDEPNTPYTHYDVSSHHDHAESGDEISVKSHSPSEHEQNSSKICWETLERKLEHVAANRERSSSVSSLSSREEESKAKVEFKKLRSQHYNEAMMMRKFKEAHPDGFNDEDEDDDDEIDANKKMKE